MARRLNLYHLATAILVLFFLGHTLGGMIFHHNANTEEKMIRKLMQEVHIPMHGASCTYFDFYFGFGLIVSVFFLLSAFITWQMSKPDAPREFRVFNWALLLSYFAVLLISVRYFFAGPAVTSALLVAIFAYQCFQKPAGAGDRN